ncbi:hypothetical protein V8J88_09135 [Massilia sp. W12]|uniref:hypothetical protein n=1 Tax=Massilia sp. W12 TaxID=3126507 RepID=UPI0030CB814A
MHAHAAAFASGPAKTQRPLGAETTGQAAQHKDFPFPDSAEGMPKNDGQCMAASKRSLLHNVSLNESAMDYKELLQSCQSIRAISALHECALNLPDDGWRVLRYLQQEVAQMQMAILPAMRIDGDLLLTKHEKNSSHWYEARNLACLFIDGDLTVTGDLLDCDYHGLPILLVRGNMTMRNWLRGGMSTFVHGHVSAQGYIIGHYNDSALFVGGALHAQGYMPRARPYPDMQDVIPHQIQGGVFARQFDIEGAENEDYLAAFAPEVLGGEDGYIWLEEDLVIERQLAGLPVWRT